MNHKLIEQRLKRVIIELADEFSGNFERTKTFPTPDDILYIFNENELFVVDIESYDNPKPRNLMKDNIRHENKINPNPNHRNTL